MTRILGDWLARLVSDPWRQENGFSPDVRDANDRLYAAQSDDERKAVLAEWLQQHQPCLFGRIAAQRDLLAYCILTADDLNAGDDFVQDKIQTSRTKWSAAATEGRQSGFIIAVVLPELAEATPDQVVGTFAQRLCELYLLEDHIEFDRIYTDTLRVEAPGTARATWEWDVGVNYFSAQGDRRWWHDHRIPGGIALSMNSVGHMVKATIVSEEMTHIEKRLGIEPTDWADGKVNSPERALILAMMTIHRAADGPSGKATWLEQYPGPGVLPPCPVKLPAEIADKNYCEYAGFYHTDVTLPSVYFAPAVSRPDSLPAQRLEFKYLIEGVADKIDWLRAGGGRRIREATNEGDQNQGAKSKRKKAYPTIRYSSD